MPSVTVPLSEDTYLQAQRAAEARGTTLSEWMAEAVVVYSSTDPIAFPDAE
ncbi:hypothetical protein BH11ARM2_BH11ARM2_34830 [soil metagenome]